MFGIGKLLQFFANNTCQAKQYARNIRNIPAELTNAGKIGIRCSKIDKKNTIQTFYTTSTAVVKKGLKPHLPALFAGIGLCTPIPLGSVAGYGIGKVLQRII